MYESELLAEKIKAYAKCKKIALKTIFEECGMGRNSMAHLTAGKSLAYDSLAKIADQLDCSVDYLLGRTDNPLSHKFPASASLDMWDLESRAQSSAADQSAQAK